MKHEDRFHARRLGGKFGQPMGLLKDRAVITKTVVITPNTQEAPTKLDWVDGLINFINERIK